MAKSYPKETVTPKPCVIDDETLKHIGKLIRACAEIEDVITQHIRNIARLDEWRVSVILGQMAISSKIRLARKFEGVWDASLKEMHQKQFNDDFLEILDVRNCLAHGSLLGWSDEEGYHFLTDKEPHANGEENQFRITVAFKPDVIAKVADIAERVIPQLEKNLRVEELRKRRHGRPLEPHKNAHPPEKAKGKKKGA